MRCWRLVSVILVVLALPWLSLGAEPRLRPVEWAVPVISDYLDNWYRVDARLYRSEQPDAAGMADIESMEIRRILSLREYHSDEAALRKAHLQAFRVPINTSYITDDQMVQALKIILASDQPILVHCWHGADRTGVVVAMYRMVVQGWSKKSAIDEMMHGGYRYHAIYDNIVEYLNNVDVEAIRNRL